MITTSATLSAVSTNRVRYALVTIFAQVVLGVLYTWSVFRGPLAQLHGWSEAQTITPYRYSLLAFAAGMIVAGLWQDRKGPRVVATVGGLLLGTGCLLASFFGDTVEGLVFSYGVLGGLGVGFGYVPPIATCIKWFPDKRGMIVGLSVMGSGMGPVLYGPLLEKLVGKDPSQFHATIPRTFLILAAVFYVCVIGSAQLYRVPPPSWKPAGWTPPSGHVRAHETPPRRVLATWQFYTMWMLYFLGASVGLTAIGSASPIIQQVSRSGAALSGGAALGVMSLFNGAGRLTWGTVSDRFGRKLAIILMSTLSVVACLAFLRPAAGFWPVLTGLCLAAFAYGGYLALMPSLTADYYGPKNVGANYGMLYTAWGLCGFATPGYFAGIMDRYRETGNLLGGYGEVYLKLALFALAGLALAALLRRPRGPENEGGLQRAN